MRKKIEDMIGRTFVSVTVGDADMLFIEDNGDRWEFYHDQDCCERVYLQDMEGDVSDLQGSPLLVAEESTNRDLPPVSHPSDDSYTWTFYKFATNKGYVDVRWYGESNGYYSEGVDLHFIPKRQ
jgi:hypothetical protein